MPLYEYKCEFGHIIEVSQKLDEKPLEVCPKCRGKIKKVYSKFNTEKSRVQS